MTTTDINPIHIFADARRMHDAALARMAEDDIRDAAEKAWCATLRAAEALVLVHTNQHPPRSPDVTRALRTIAAADPSVRGLQSRYFERQAALHGACFYTGWCEPVEDTQRLIRETAEFIRDAESLALKSAAQYP